MDLTFQCFVNVQGGTLRIDYLTLILKRLTDPLRMLPKDDAVQKVVEFMDLYSISQEDFDTIVELSKFQGHPKSAGGHTASCQAPKKRIAAILEPVDDELARENGDALAESEEENSSDTDDMDTANVIRSCQWISRISTLKVGNFPFILMRIKVELDLKGAGSSSAKKTPAGRGRGGGSASTEKKGGRGSGAAGAKRKR
ncbi:Replication factor C subunit 1 [Vitis vinifera]|uniref:Replication factor C subunit 1 n=1 Tax=Vitis vinifera TaxID=29760 RepID=A0A438BNW4_VITVI|nr:Replication factor C subunit 1 [Vitis vinifera]